MENRECKYERFYREKNMKIKILIDKDDSGNFEEEGIATSFDGAIELLELAQEAKEYGYDW